VVEVAPCRLDRDVVGRQPDVGVRATVVLLDVGLEVVGVCDRPETWRQRREDGECHVIAVVADLSYNIVLHRSHDLISRLSRWVTDRTLRVATVFLVLGTPPVLDVMALALLALHDPVDATWRTVLAVVVEATSQLSLLALVVMLIDVTAGIATTPVLVKVGT
jgi:hypothetical protein